MALRTSLLLTLTITCQFFSAHAMAWFWDEEDDQKVMQLGELLPIEVSPTYDLVKVSTDEQIAVYRKLLNHIHSRELTAKVLVRIADLELMLQEQKVARSEALLDEANDESGDLYEPDYSIAIEAYNIALQRYPQRPNNDEVLYQLAKAYDLSGKPKYSLGVLTQLVNQFPDSTYYVEAQFRRGDLLFSYRRYEESLIAYRTVVSTGEQTAYYENAIYMQGWSLFKQDRYESALRSFSQVLDLTMPPSGNLAGVDNSKLSLVKDSLRIMSIMFADAEGPETIASTYVDAPKSYEGLLYEKLGQLYVQQERFQDAIKTYRYFIGKHPFSYRSPEFQNEIIRTLRLGKLFNQVFPEKEAFISQYQPGSEFYGKATLQTKRYINGYLYVYLDEAGRFYHSRAQRIKRRYKEVPPKYKKNMVADFQLAIERYQQFMASFKKDPHNAEKSYMQAEAYIALGDYRSAITAYETAAYDLPLNVFSEKAAYASILAYRALVKREKDIDLRKQYLQEKLNTQMAFGDFYPFSPYARPVLLDSIDLLYTQERYELAVEQADIFLNLKPKGSPKELLTIWTVKAHSNFKLANYSQSELDYKKTMSYLSKKDKRYWIMNNQMAASVYKQGEVLASEEKYLEAVEQFLRVATISPDSKYRKTADYDAATYLLKAEKWQQAIDLVKAYRKRYDPKKNDLDITGKLIYAYEKMDNFVAAANELKRVYRDEKDPEKKRQALFLAAEYYDKAGSLDKALDTFKRYAHEYPKPFDLMIETQYRLSQMYEKKKDDNRRRYWLEKIIISDRDAGDERTTRSKFLAAYSRNVFADDKFKVYETIKLTWPIGESLAVKREAMDDLLRRYKQLMEYGVQEYSTQSQYRVAQVYGLLADALLESEQPPGMDELEAEEYVYLLEDEALPFQDQAIEIHESNIQNSWNGNYDEWVQQSMESLAGLMPGRYNKKEAAGKFSVTIY